MRILSLRKRKNNYQILKKNILLTQYLIKDFIIILRLSTYC